MIVAGSASPLLLSSAGGYNLTKSLRFRSSASAYLNRTPASAGNQKTWTWSGWVKRGTLGVTNRIFTADDGSASTDQDYNTLFFTSSDQIKFAGNLTDFRTTTAVYRDPSAWYHIVFVTDTTQATAANRFRLYVNGVEVTAFGTSNNPSQNTDLAVNNNIAHYIGSISPAGSSYFDGYMTEINFIDGQALTPSSFGQTSSTTGVWQPIKYTGTYGTNGFYLPFTDVATTSGSNAGLGKDFSGNGNYWTTNNISVTTGTTYDSMSDVPTLTNATTANYCVLNPLDTGGTAPSSANLELIAGAAERGVRSTFAIPTTGLYYAEAVVGTNQSGATDIAFGFVARTTNLSANPSGISNGWLCYATATTNITRNGTSTLAGAGTALVSGDVLQLAIDLANNKGWLGKNNTWFNGTTGTDGNPSTGANPTFTFSSPPELFVLAHCYSSTINVNFGQRPFSYTPPAGFKTLCTTNLSTPTIGATASTQANKYMDATTYSGNGGTQSITSLGFQPDLVWVKRRNAVASHNLVDAVRGASKILYSDATTAEITDTNDINAFNSNGWTMGLNTDVNASGGTYVGWTWRGANGTVTNTAGSITSTVSANTTAGFSIVTWTGNGSNSDQTLGTGLSTPLDFIITKPRGANVGSDSWLVYTSAITLNQNECLVLNSTSGKITGADQGTPSRGSTSGQLKLYAGTLSGSNNRNLNSNGVNYVAYCFSAVAGYSAFGSYTGNGSTDGPFIFTGFRPRFVFVKNASSTGSWIEFDSSTNPYNEAGNLINLNTSGAEFTTSDIKFDILSNGFKVRQVNSAVNGSGNTLIYAAFAESPFKYALAR